MSKRFQLAPVPHIRSAWQRWLVVATIFLVAFAAVGQAAHTHAGTAALQPAHAKTQLSDGHMPPDDVPCPLCDFFHSSLPTHAPSLFALIVPFARLRRRRERSTAPSRCWHFDLFSRPPPSCSK